MKLTERLGKEWVFFDGGMGTILQAHGLKAGELPETWNLSHPDEIIALATSCIAKYQTFDEVCVTRAGCTVSSHCGPGTIGILFIRK